MAEQLTLDHLLQAARAGGPSVLSSVTRLVPAAGPHGRIAPARYTTRSGNATYVYEDRFVNGEPAITVLIDSKSSMGNRLEDALQDAIADGHSLLERLPRIEVTYDQADDVRTFSCLTLPHRAFDAHIRAGEIDGVPTTQHPDYVRARNSNPSSALDMLNTSFATVSFGAWDSSRRARQARYPSLMVGEIIGVLVSQDGDPRPAKFSGARVDPVAMGLDLDAKGAEAILEPQTHEYSKKFLEKKTKKASELGLGAIPPSDEGLAGISTREIIRSHVLSFALLRRLRFGQGPDGDANIRALIAATLLAAMARSDSELHLRANCHLREVAAPEVLLDLRNGEELALSPITIEQSDALLAAAYEAAKPHGVDWTGVTLRVTGNPIVVGSADDGATDG